MESQTEETKDSKQKHPGWKKMIAIAIKSMNDGTASKSEIQNYIQVNYPSTQYKISKGSAFQSTLTNNLKKFKYDEQTKQYRVSEKKCNKKVSQRKGSAPKPPRRTQISLSHKIINSNGHKNIDNIMIDTLYVSDYVSKHKLNPSKLLSQIENESEYIPRSKMTFTIYGKTMELPRDKQFYGDTLQNGYKPLYRYGGNYLPKVYDFPKTLKMLRDKVKEYQYCNHCVLNRYKNGTDYIGFHRDKTKDFLVNSGVIILSFGTERILRFKRDDNIIKKIILKANNNNNDKVEIDMIKKLPKLVNLRLKSGSLCFVGDKTNTYYKHSIVKQSKNVIKGKRISLTLRNIHTQFKPGKNGKPATIIEATKK
eukprot:476734_1